MDSPGVAEQVAPDAATVQEWQPAALWHRLSERTPRVSPAVTWAASGFLFGVAAAHAFHLSAVTVVVVGVLVGALSWLGHGVATVLIAACLTIGLLGLALRLTMVAFATESWSMVWLLPLGALMLIGAVLVARRFVPYDAGGSRLAAGLLELASGVGSLGLVLLCLHRLGSASASSILLSSEDNAAWLNTVGGLQNARGTTHDSFTAVGLFGPVANTFLAFARELSGGLLLHKVPTTRSGDIVVSCYVLLIACGPVVAGLMARRTLRHGRPALTFVAWAGLCVVLGTYAFVTPDHGFLTTGLAILLVLVAASLLPARTPDVLVVVGLVRWCAVVLALYTAGAAWIAVTPLAAVAIAGWCLAIAVPALRTGPWRRVGVVAVLMVPAALMCGALLMQYRDVTDPVGGGEGLFTSTGGTPAATATMTATAVVLVAAAWLGRRRWSGLPSYATPLAALLGYAAASMLAEGYLTREPPHYGTIKLLYVTVGLVLALGVADLLASPALVRLDAAVVVVVVALFVGTVDQGPMFAAAVGHWPKPQLPTIWTKQVTREVPKARRVLCLGLTAAPDLSQPSLDAYLCDRWASSLQGLDDDPAGDWRDAQLGRVPVAKVVTWIKAAHDKPWTIVVIGPLAKVKDPKAWYAPIAAQPGLQFISSGF